jgi:hypothetical protein
MEDKRSLPKAGVRCCDNQEAVCEADIEGTDLFVFYCSNCKYTWVERKPRNVKKD